MGIKEFYDGLTAPSKDKLLSQADSRDDTINNCSILQDSIDILREKILSNPEPKTKKLLQKQIEDLLELEKYYNKYMNSELSYKTNEKLIKLFESISSQIGNDYLSDDIEEIKNIFDDEKYDFENRDSVFSKLNYRDHVEKNIDFVGHIFHETYNETYEMDKFIHSFTVYYVDLITEKGDINSLDKKGKLILTLDELNQVLYRVPDIYKKNDLIVKFDLINIGEVEVRLSDFTQDYLKQIDDGKKLQEKINETKMILVEYSNMINNINSMGFSFLNINPDKYNSLEELTKAEEKLKLEINKYAILKGLSHKIKGGGENVLNINVVKENIKHSKHFYELARNEFKDDFSQILLGMENKENFKFRDFLENYYLPESTKKILLNYIENILKDTKVNGLHLGDKKVNFVFNKDFIDKNIDKIFNNFKVFLSFLLSVESSGGLKYAKNPVSTARGAFQYLNQVDLKDGKKTSFHVALTRVKNFSEENSLETPEYIKYALKNINHITPMDMTMEQSLNMFIYDLFKKILLSTKENKETIVAMLSGNQLAIRKAYEERHHTINKDNKNFTNKETEELTTKILNKIVPYLQTASL